MMWLADPQAEPMCTGEAFTERTGRENAYRRRVAGYVSFGVHPKPQSAGASVNFTHLAPSTVYPFVCVHLQFTTYPPGNKHTKMYC